MTMPDQAKWIRCLVALTIALAVLPTAASPRVAAVVEWRQEPASQGRPQPAASAKTWIGRAAEIEEYLKTAPVVRTEDLGRGVTRPKRAYFAPGGSADSMVWKQLRPGMSRGFYESYKSEIAAYEIDKLLALQMVPPKVERRLVKAKMFQNLIGDLDPNLGNWLVDPAWNLILVDHSRALTRTEKLVHQMQRIEADLWTRMKALTEETLTTAVGAWIGKSEVRAILARREKMQAQIDGLVRATSEAQVFIR